MKKQKVVGRVKKFFFFLELRTVRIDDVANENKEVSMLSKRERENNKRFLVTQRKPKLKTLGD